MSFLQGARTFFSCFSTGPNEIYDLSILSEKPTIFITLISDHVELKALYGVAPGHQSLKHVFPTGGTHVAPSRNRTIVIGGRHVFLISKKGLLFALWFPAFAGMTECGCYSIYLSNLFSTTVYGRHAVEKRHPSEN